MTFIEKVNVYVWTHNHLDSTQRRALSGAIQFPVRVSTIWSPGPPGLADITWWTPGLLVTSPDDLGPDFSWSGSVCAAVCYNSRPTVQAHYVRPDPGRPWWGKVLQVSLFSLGRAMWASHTWPDTSRSRIQGTRPALMTRIPFVLVLMSGCFIFFLSIYISA